MKKTMFVTSALAVFAVAPVMADYVEGGPYINNETFASTCDVGHIGVTTGTANTVAQYTPRTYICTAGNYLINGDDWSENYAAGTDGDFCGECPDGSYCPGVQVVYDEEDNDDEDTGIVECPDGYEFSAGGQSAVTACYRACVSTDSPNATSMIGMVYSDNTGEADGVNTCEPADANSCAAGYTYVARDGNTLAHCTANDITIIWTDKDGAQFGEVGTCTYDSSVTTPTNEPEKRGYTFTGWKFVAPAAEPEEPEEPSEPSEPANP